MRIDHVIYAARDLDEATARIEAALGVPAAGGGRHAGHGTVNRIVPLGGGYIEVVAVADAEEASISPFGRGVAARLERDGDGWVTWVVVVPDADAVARRLGAPVTELRRAGLSARLTGVAEAMAEPYLPFFMSRDTGVADPGAVGDAGGITRVEVAGDAERLSAWLDGAALPVHVVAGPPALRAIGVGERTHALGSLGDGPTPGGERPAPRE